MHVTKPRFEQTIPKVSTSRGANPSTRGQDESKEKLNVIMLMVDSLSNANAQRHLKKTYKFLSEDPNSFVLSVNTSFFYSFIFIFLIHLSDLNDTMETSFKLLF